jgi:hypothetical protein
LLVKLARTPIDAESSLGRWSRPRCATQYPDRPLSACAARPRAQSGAEMGRCDSQCRRTSAGRACMRGTAARAARRRAVRFALDRHRFYGPYVVGGPNGATSERDIAAYGAKQKPSTAAVEGFCCLIVEPVDGIEPTTCCLQNHCPTRTRGVKGRQRTGLFGIAKLNSPHPIGHIRTSADVQTVRDTVRRTVRAGGAA